MNNLIFKPVEFDGFNLRTERSRTRVESEVRKSFLQFKNEVVKTILDGLAKDCCNKKLELVYKNWIDSVSYKGSFNRYLGNYKLPEDLDIWKVNINHPFRQIDERWLAEIGKNIPDKSTINSALEKLHLRDQSKREKYLLTQNPGITIDFVRLSEINKETQPGQFLICPYKDIDDIGEKLQQKALKYYSEAIDFFAEKISLFLSCGYSKVYLISDHGFVLTVLLSEADKIAVSVKGIFDKAERYIRTVNKQSDITPGLIEVEKKYKQFGYLYFAKNINPFKTPGLYGFSHGGVSAQELITPYFCWEHSPEQTSSLSVEIENKEDLRNVTGELFTIKIQADKNSGDLFIIQRFEQINKEYAFDGHPKIEVHLLDATTKQQLDLVVVKQNKDRDLSGLL